MPGTGAEVPRCPDLPRLIGHRGLAAHAPENTLAGIRMAKAHGVRWVECDAKLTADGVAILMHDDRLDRTTDGTGPVAATPFAAIRALDAGSWFAPGFAGERIPTLVEALELVLALDLGCNLEIKPCPGREMETAGVVAATLLRHWPANRGQLVVSSFERPSIARLRDVAPGLPRGLLVWDRIATMLADAAGLGCASIHCAHQHFGAGEARAIKAAGYGLIVYTVNEPALARRLIEWGADTIISDTAGVLGDEVSPAGPARGMDPAGSTHHSGPAAAPEPLAGPARVAPAEDDRGPPAA
jgi:glycerophosphoryl diester phosphodiesterase